MTEIEPVLLLHDVLDDFGYDVERGDVIDKRALSSPGYVFVQQVGGTARSIRGSFRPEVQIIVYSNRGWRESNRISRQIRLDLLTAAQECRKYPSGGIHRIMTSISPYRQDIAGLPPGVGRSAATYDLILSTLEKWRV